MALNNDGPSGRSGLRQAREALVARPVLGTMLAVIVATALSIAFVDRPINRYVTQDLDPNVAAFFHAVTEIGDGTVYIIASALVWLVFRWLAAQAADSAVAQRFKRIAAYGAFALTALLAAGAVASILKYALGRFRPSMLLTDGVYGLAPLSFLPKTTSLPSGHTQVIWTVVTILLLLKPRIGLLLIPVAILAGASRIAINVHFLSDVLLGAYIGVLVPLLVYVAFFPRLGPAPERLGQVRRILGLSS